MERLAELAAAVADGRPIDWSTVEQTPATDALRALAKLTELHWTLHHSPEQAAQTPLDTPDVWGHLEVLEQLDSGSFGTVFVALDSTLNRLVALKLLRVSVDDPMQVERALAEGRMLAKVRNPHVATVHGADVLADRVGLWMELIRGHTLSKLVTLHGPMGAREATLIGLDLCQALAAVHREGILHRDLKAQNIMREEGGRIVLVDFGVGRDLNLPEDREDLTGTPLYLAPELFEGHPASIQTDLYSLGVLLFYLVTGSFPVRRGSMSELRRAHRAHERTRLLDLRPNLPASFVDCVERLLAPEPEDRPSSAGEAARHLSRSLEAISQTASPFTRSPPWRWLGGAITLLVLMASFWWFNGGPGSGAESTTQEGLQVTTTSDRALALYDQALLLHDQGDITEAIEPLEVALDLDSEFAMAYARLAIYKNGIGRWEEALNASERAFELKEQVSPAERYFIEGIHSTYRLRYEAALRSFQRVAQIDRSNAEAQRLLALLHGNLGEFQEAIDPAKRAVELEPRSVINRGVLAVLLATGGSPLGALDTVETARRELVDAATEDLIYLHWGEGLAWLVEGDLQRARHAFETLIRGKATYESHGRLFLCQIEVLEGDLDHAIATLESGFHLNRRKDFERNASTAHLWVAKLHYLNGRRAAARHQLSLALRGLPDLPTHLKSLREITLAQAEMSFLDDARKGLQRLTSIAESYPSRFARSATLQVEGELALSEGTLDVSQARLEEARETWEDPSTLWSLARFWLTQNRCDQAEPLLETLRAQRGRIIRDFFVGISIETEKSLEACRK